MLTITASIHFIDVKAFVFIVVDEISGL